MKESEVRNIIQDPYPPTTPITKRRIVVAPSYLLELSIKAAAM
jgi:hypothetical protein